jgi:hypothetical protein
MEHIKIAESKLEMKIGRRKTVLPRYRWSLQALAEEHFRYTPFLRRFRDSRSDWGKHVTEVTCAASELRSDCDYSIVNEWQRNSEDGSFAVIAAVLDAALVGFDNLATEIQTQTGSGGVQPAHATLPKPLEQAKFVFFRHTGAVV